MLHTLINFHESVQHKLSHSFCAFFRFSAMDIANTDINLDLLRLLSTLYRTHSLSVTAAQNHLSLSTASRKLREARVLFEDELFTRSGQVMYPTPRMDELISSVDHLISELTALFHHDTFKPEDTERTIRIAALDGIYALILAPVIEKIRRTAPGIRFSIVPITLSTFEDLKAGTLDFLLYGTDQEPIAETIKVQPLIKTGFCLLMRQDHPLTRVYQDKGRFDEADLVSWPMLALQTPYSLARPTATMPWFNDVDLLSETMLPYQFASVFQLLESDTICENNAPFGWYLMRHLPGITALPFEGFTHFQWTPTLFWHQRLNTDPVIQWLRCLIKCEADTLYQRFAAEWPK